MILALVSLLTLQFVTLAQGSALEFDAYRLVQYQVTEDQSGHSDQYSAAMEHTVTHFGSQATTVNSQNAVHFSHVLAATEPITALRDKKVCVIHYDDVVKLGESGSLLKELGKQGTAGLLIMLLDADRAHGGDKGSLEEQRTFQAFSDALTNSLVGFPVFFTFESDDLLTWYNLLLRKDPRVDDLAINVKAHSGRTYLTE